jgi:hypothetical protein
VQQVLASTPVKHIVVTSLGDMLGPPKGTLVNFVVKYVKKMVPPGSCRALNLPAHAKGAAAEFEAGAAQPG